MMRDLAAIREGRVNTGKSKAPCGEWCEMVQDLPEEIRVQKACETCDKYTGALVTIRRATPVYLDLVAFDKSVGGFIREMYLDGLLDETDIHILGVAK
jgi:hypothetical protein